MSDDEEDYMSEAFLAKCVPEDVRPGLKRVSQNLYPNFCFQETFFSEEFFFNFVYLIDEQRNEYITYVPHCPGNEIW